MAELIEKDQLENELNKLSNKWSMNLKISMMRFLL